MPSGLSAVYGSGVSVVWYPRLETTYTLYDKIIFFQYYFLRFWDERVNFSTTTVQTEMGISPKEVHPPPQTLTKRLTLLFADGDVYVVRQIESKSKSAAFDKLPGHLPTTQNFFLFASV